MKTKILFLTLIFSCSLLFSSTSIVFAAENNVVMEENTTTTDNTNASETKSASKATEILSDTILTENTDNENIIYQDNIDDLSSVIPDEIYYIQEYSEKEVERQSLLETLCVSYTDDYINIYQENNENSEITGKLYSNCVSTILDIQGDWVEISSGNIESGWVQKEQLFTGSQAVKLAEILKNTYGEVTAKSLRVHKDEDLNSSTVCSISKDTLVLVISDKGDLVQIETSSGQEGWVSSEYLTIWSEYPEAETIEEEQERIEEENEEEKLKEQQEKLKAIETGYDLSTLDSSNRIYDITEEDYDILLRIVEAEASGQGLMGKLLVANVVLNRVNHPSFPNTIKEVVYAGVDGGKVQFSPVANGRINTVTVSEETVQAVELALCGEDESQGALYFMNPAASSSSNVTWFETALTYLFTYKNHAFYTR